MVSAVGLVAQSIPIIYPEPSQKILDLFYSYGYKYPGNSAPAGDIDLITLTLLSETPTTQSNITKFLTSIYPKLRPSELTSVALSFEEQIISNPSIQSNIYNFYSLTNNTYSDILPGAVARPVSATVTNLETIYNKYALSYILNIFNKHASDIIDNPHHVSGANLQNVWNDFFQALYNKYITFISPAATLQEFITSKTTMLQVANLQDYLEPTTQNYLSTLDTTNALINTHNISTDSLVHPELQTILSAEVDLPNSTYYITPNTYMNQFDTLSTTPTVYLIDELTGIQKINWFVINMAAVISQVAVGASIITLMGTPGYKPYYYPYPLYNTWTPINGTLFFNITTNLADTNTIPIVTLSNNSTGENITIEKVGGVTNSLSILVYVQGIAYGISIPAFQNNVTFFLNWTTSAITIYYLDANGNLISSVTNISNLVMAFDTVQFGIEIDYPENTTNVNTIQEFTLYKKVLTVEQMQIITNSNLLW